MKRISWNPEKNEWLKEARGVSFEQVADILEQNKELDVIDTKRGRYSVFIVK